MSVVKEESLSIEETNKLRKQLGLAPLEMNDGPKAKESENGSDSKEKVVVEDGMEFVHKVPEHMGEKKRAEEVKEKLQVMREKRRIYDKVLKTKGLAESDSDEDASAWVIKNRQMEEERKRAEERVGLLNLNGFKAKLLDDMDAEFGVDTMIEDEKKRRAENIQKKKRQQKQKSDTAGLVVGHSKEDFLEGNETVLVLEDRDVLAEGDEVLVNPNIVDNTKYAKNAELRKKKGSYQPYPEESLDDYGVQKAKTVLSKYDEELEGEERQMFRLDESGEVDLEKERQEMLIRKNLMMANKRLESIENQKYRVASEFYTAEEMISFRRPSKKKDGKKLRKRKVRVLRADDLVPEETTQEDEKARALRLAAHKVGSLAHKVKQETAAEVDDEAKQGQTDGSKKLEDGEVNEDGSGKGIAKSDGKWQRAETSGLVDIQLLNKFVEREEKEDEESDDDDGKLFILVFILVVVLEI
ncbi:unnamed protein product [Anisakis simplex]|uniref:U4/U6.U5 tri-snRNP-associated protein 1 (inferred by orthology to a human protein) n=1 Tax=Anisakis simplex TaxID=6269 RepID=A0A0M3J237_ANISI|nr:unnamed protein product [Anisakis simplex]